MRADALASICIALLAMISTLARAQTADIVATVADEQGRPIEDAVVVAMPVDGNVRLAPRSRVEMVDQIDKEFRPRVKAIAVGTSVNFPNHDNVRHHVYSFSTAKRFELPLYAGIPAQQVVFDKPGVVVLGCNIHDWMIGYIYVSASPYFATTEKDGKAVLADLPLRAYVVRVWHPQLETGEEATRQNVDATRAGRLEVSWTLKLRPEVRVRRAPTSERGGRY
jgi:plastocyanin